VGSTQSISIVDLASVVIQALDSGSEIELVPYEQVRPAGYEDMRQRRPSVEKLVALVGFSPQTPLMATIREMIKAGHAGASTSHR
jgi:UDP-glucose 4-epimerase